MKIKQIGILIFLLAFGSSFAQKMTQEEFMKKYFEKTGNDKYKTVKTMVIEGETQIMKDIYPFRLHFKAPNQYRMKERYNSDFTYKIISGETRKAVASEGRQMDMSQLEIDMIFNLVNFLEGFLTNYKENGFKIEYLGLDTLNKTTAFRRNLPNNIPAPPVPMKIANTEPFDINKVKIDTLLTAVCHKIKVTTPQQKDFVMKVDTTSMNILWSSGNPFIYADIASIKFNLYKNFDGINFPVHMVVESNFIPATYRISSVKINEEIPEAYFDPNSKENVVVPDN